MYVFGNIMETETTRFLDGVNDETDEESWRRHQKTKKKHMRTIKADKILV